MGKLKDFYTKPRTGFIFRLSTWILSNPEALGIIFIMGFLTSVVLFGSLLIVAFVYGWGLWLKVIMGLLLALSLRNLYKLIRIGKNEGGVMKIMETSTLKSMVFGKNKKT